MPIGKGSNPDVGAAAVARFVRERRLRSGLTQEDLATAVGVSRPWVSSLERGWPASEELMFKILMSLGVPDPSETLGRLRGANPPSEGAAEFCERHSREDLTRELRKLAQGLRTRLREYEDARSFVALSDATLAAVKATIFDLEEMACADHIPADRFDDARKAWRYFTGTLMLSRQAANAAKLGLKAMAERSSAVADAGTPEDLSDGDHQTE